jgi:hypothetical protein
VAADWHGQATTHFIAASLLDRVGFHRMLDRLDICRWRDSGLRRRNAHRDALSRFDAAAISGPERHHLPTRLFHIGACSEAESRPSSIILLVTQSSDIAPKLCLHAAQQALTIELVSAAQGGRRYGESDSP